MTKADSEEEEIGMQRAVRCRFVLDIQAEVVHLPDRTELGR
jgi:hypothetical protein